MTIEAKWSDFSNLELDRTLSTINRVAPR